MRFIIITAFLYCILISCSNKNTENIAVDDLEIINMNDIREDEEKSGNNYSIDDEAIRSLLDNVKDDNDYFLVCKYIADSIPFTLSNQSSIYFFDDTEKFLSKYKYNDMTLVVAFMPSVIANVYFFIEKNEIKGVYLINNIRRADDEVDSRRIEDWDNDGIDEIIEERFLPERMLLSYIQEREALNKDDEDELNKYVFKFDEKAGLVVVSKERL